MKRILMLLGTALCLRAAAQTTYTNPVYNADFPDPSVQRAQDGYWYAYSTGQKGVRSTDLVNWTRLSNVISRPTWNDSTYVTPEGEKKTDYYSFWACDVNYVDNAYLMYYACALWGNGTRTGIGVATGTSPATFTDKGKLFRSTEIGVKNSIDPCYVEEFDKKYLVWGSFHDIYISELSDDGLTMKNPKVKAKIGGGAFEGAMIYKRGSYYYLFCSVGSCCEGVKSTYRTVVGRSTKLTGPYVNKQGGKMFENNYTTIIQGNDRWKGPGHNSEIVTDDEGNDWLLYHAYDANDDSKGRVMLLDKITWDGNDWPVISDGTPSTTPQEAPVFYKNDGSVRTYRVQNADFHRSNWRGWTARISEDATTASGAGTAFMPMAYVKNGGTFDISQTMTGMTNGLYEMELNGFDTDTNVDFYMNELSTLARDTTLTTTPPTSEAALASTFLRGSYKRKVYGLVYDGNLTIGARTRNPLGATERFYMANLKLTFRHQNEEVTNIVIDKYKALADELEANHTPYYSNLRSSAETAYEAILAASTASVRYSKLVAYAKAMGSVMQSVEVYDSLRRQTEWMQGKMEEAREKGYLSEEAATTLAEAKAVLTECNYTDANVLKLITRMIAATENMPYAYQQGDGTQASPYVISRPEQLMNMCNVLVRSQMTYFVMDADVDMQDFTWEQLNTTSASYRLWINFDGRGHVIKHLKPAAASGYPSFFGTLVGECRNVGFVDAEVVSTGSGAAVIAGSVGSSTYKDDEGNPLPCIVENCYVTGNITSKGYAGAVAGIVNNVPVYIRNVYTNVDITGNGTSSNYCGGIVGRVRTALTIENCYSAGAVSAPIAAPISAGGQTDDTPASLFQNVIAWNRLISGTSVAVPFAVTVESDVLTGTHVFEEMLVNDQPVEGGLTHAQLQEAARQWGSPWHSNPAAGNGYPILQWQYDRGDYAELCGFPKQDGIEGLSPSPSPIGRQTIYSLQGQKIIETIPPLGEGRRGSLPKGIYIVNGVKVLVK